MNIAVIGSGYVGLITGAGFAKLGHSVVCFDIDSAKVDAINRKQPPIFEEGLQEALDELVPNFLTASTDFSKLGSAEVIFICVGTPSKPDGSIDLKYVSSAANLIGAALKRADGFKIVVVKSTVSPSTTVTFIRRCLEEASGKKAGLDFGLAMSPEFLREGSALYDFSFPDRIVIGALDGKSFEVLNELYFPLDRPILRTDPTSAEMIKYASNAFLATKISFINEIGNISKKLGINANEVAKGIGLDKRIGNAFLNSGIGYGGSCFPKDVSELRHFSKSLGIKPILLDAVIQINEEQPLKFVEMVESRIGAGGVGGSGGGGGLIGKKVGVLGLAFKNNTDDIRESRVIPIVKLLLDKGADVFAFDYKAMENFRRIFPESGAMHYLESAESVVKNSEVVLITTEWQEFSSLDFTGKRVFEGKRVLSDEKSKKFGAEGMCW